MLKNKPIGFIGGGAMAEALIRGLLKADLVVASQITVADVSTQRLEYLTTTFGVATTHDSQELVRQRGSGSSGS